MRFKSVGHFLEHFLRTKKIILLLIRKISKTDKFITHCTSQITDQITNQLFSP